MTNRTRNFSILGVVLLLLAAAGFIIATKSTRLGLDLQGGTELVYQGQPTPQVPTVTPQALDDALNTIRKRTDALGVSEPEIQRSGRDQISIGLPDVQNAQRAIDQVGSTAQLQFYDWEPNVLGDRGPDVPYAGSKALYDAVEVATKQEPKAEQADVPPGSDLSPAEADKQNDTIGDQYYLFGPDRFPIGPDKQPLREGDYKPSATCDELLSDYEREGGTPNKYAKGTECLKELEALGPAGPPDGSRVFKVPQGIVVVEGEPAPNQSERVHRFFVIEDDSELSGKEIKNPEQNFDPNTQQPLVTMEFTDTGREAFARVTKQIAERGRDCETLAGVSEDCPPVQQGAPPEEFFQRFAITLDNTIVSLATIDYQDNPEGIDGRTGASIENIGTISEAQDLAESLRIGALPINLKLISQTQVSATLGQQALDQGLTAAAAGLALTILFLLIFYRVLGVVATVALLVYAAMLFALIKLIPITLTLPGIAGMVLTLAVAADANIVMYERIKEEVRSGRSVPAAISAGYTKALRTIIDANVVTIGVAFILFTLATAGVKGFAFTLGVGTLVSLFTAVLATSAILGTLARTRLLRRPSALGVATKARKGWTFDFMGNSRWFFSFSGAILAAGAIAISTLGINFGIDFESGTRITAPLQQAASVDDVRSTLEPLGYGDAEVQSVDDPELGKNVVQIEVAELDPSRGRRGRERARRGLRGRERRLLDQLGRADVRRADRAHRGARGDRVAAPDLALHRLPLRVEVRGAGADRAGARPAHHRGCLCHLREGGHDRHGRRLAHDHGLLALRHRDRVRPNTRERAAHAARDLLADREPLDVRGVHAIAGHELRGADAGRRAAPVRRRDAEGLRVRAARRRALGRLLVDLHRHAGAGRVEGARADLHAQAPPDAPGARRAHPGVRAGHARRAGAGGRHGAAPRPPRLPRRTRKQAKAPTATATTAAEPAAAPPAAARSERQARRQRRAAGRLVLDHALRLRSRRRPSPPRRPPHRQRLPRLPPLQRRPRGRRRRWR